MATNTHIQTAFAEANRIHMTLGQDLFAEVMPGPYSLWTTTQTGSSGKYQNNFLANLPELQRWTGPRDEKSPRAYTQQIDTLPYEATLALKRTDLTRDQTGAVAQAIGDFNRGQLSSKNRHVADALDGTSGNGPTGYDGVSLFNASHPHVNSGSGHSNLSAGTNLSHATFNTARSAMRKFLKESGSPFQITPTHMRVSPDLEQRAKEIADAADVIKFTDMTASDSTTAVQNATAMTNVWRGSVDVVVDNEITSNTYYWDLMDLSKNVKPMILVIERDIEPITRTDMDDPRRWDFDEVLFGLEADYVAVAGFWPLIYRSTGTA